MPKLKSHSGAKKRFRVTASGKVTSKKAGRKHNLSHKARNRMRKLRTGLVLAPVETKKVLGVLK
ncbi:MAG: 50S ribosomal protein L35 [Candidatus Hydrogenedentota bacterium]